MDCSSRLGGRVVHVLRGWQRGHHATAADENMPQVLAGDEVIAIMQDAAHALPREMAVAVTDRRGVILGVGTNFALDYMAQCASCPPSDITPVPPGCSDCATVNLAVQLARTAAFFSADQTPLTSRSVRFLSGVHFPPGVRNSAAAALFGIENTNRGCSFAVTTPTAGAAAARAQSARATRGPTLPGWPGSNGGRASPTRREWLHGRHCHASRWCTDLQERPHGGGIGVAIRGVPLTPDPVAGGGRSHCRTAPRRAGHRLHRGRVCGACVRR